MDPFDKIIGYEEIKQVLRQTAHTLKNSEEHRTSGVNPPKALLLYGELGVGKTLMARCLIEASGRAAFTYRKTGPDDEFAKTIKDVFDKAVEATPSIVFLDDIDKFANEKFESSKAGEYVTVQSCMDDLGDANVFVLMTANDRNCLSDSLIRPGRLGNQIEIKTPNRSDAERIIWRSISNGVNAGGVDSVVLAELLFGKSFSALEEAVDEARGIAYDESSKQITLDHLTQAILRSEYGIPQRPAISSARSRRASRSRTSRGYLYDAYCQASKIVITNSLENGRVIFSAANPDGIGITRIDCSEIQYPKREAGYIVALLGGKAALEMRFNIDDCTYHSNAWDAVDRMRKLIEFGGELGFRLLVTASMERKGLDRLEGGVSLHVDFEDAVTVHIERLYRKAKEILAMNREALDALAEALMDKNLLTARDIAEIESTHPIKHTTL